MTFTAALESRYKFALDRTGSVRTNQIKDVPRQQGVLIVKFSIAWAALAAGMFQIVVAAPLLAQVGGPAGTAGAAKSPVAPKSSGTNVAVVDISLVFEQYPEFQAQMKGLKGEVEQFEAGLRQENEQGFERRRKGSKNLPPAPLNTRLSKARLPGCKAKCK